MSVTIVVRPTCPRLECAWQGFTTAGSRREANRLEVDMVRRHLADTHPTDSGGGEAA